MNTIYLIVFYISFKISNQETKKMSSVFAIVDYIVYRNNHDLDSQIRTMWISKMRDTIDRNPDHRLSLESFIAKETTFGGSFFDLATTYKTGNIKFFALIDEFKILRGFGGISEYTRNVYELNKLCLSGNRIADDFIVKVMVRHFNDCIKKGRTEIELQVVIEKKNQTFVDLMKDNGFREYHTSRNGVNVYMKYSPK